MLEEKQPPRLIFRIGRKPNPWQAPDWSRANPDGTFGNRFDDPQGYYRVLYAATQELACFIETLARFRADLTLLAELQEIDGENDFFPLGEVPAEWCEKRLLGAAAATGKYADIYAVEWVEFLRRNLADECLRLGLGDLDAGVLQGSAPRRITQLASLRVYERGLLGICYRSKYGHNLENWALFEPFQIAVKESSSLEREDPKLAEALRILGLRLS